MRDWSEVIPEADLAEYVKGGWGVRLGGGFRPAVLVVDMSNAFVLDRYPLGHEASGRPCAAAIRRLLERARATGAPIFYTTGFSTPHPAVRGRWKGSAGDVSHPLLSSTEANAIFAEIAPQPGDVVIEKSKPSAFWCTGLVDMLVYHQIDTVIVTGMVTSGCVRATVVDAFSHNFYVLVPEECVADRARVPHNVNLFDMDMKYADVLPLDEVLTYLDRTAQSR